MGHDVHALPLEANFPMHLVDYFSEMNFSEPAVLHYHWLLDEAGRVQLTGHPYVDAAVAKVNAALSATDAVNQSASMTVTGDP
jgi:hypothetical protein